MPWEIRIVSRSTSDAPLGTRERVAGTLSQALPGAILESSPRPSAEMIAAMPEVLREHFNRPAQLNASYKTETFSIEFFATDEPVLSCLCAEVRGSGDPRAALAALCQLGDWQAINLSDDSVVELTGSVSDSAWNQFQEYRDRAIRRISADGNVGEME